MGFNLAFKGLNTHARHEFVLDGKPDRGSGANTFYRETSTLHTFPTKIHKI